MKKSLLSIIGITLIFTACGKEKDISMEEVRYAIPPTGEIEYQGHGKEVWFAIGAMSGIVPTPANGVAQAHRFEDGLFLHTIQLNIAIPEDGYFYEGWLEKDGKKVSTGHLTNPFGDVRHNLCFESDDDFTDQLEVYVTLERDDGNPAPGTVVAEGKMKVTER